MLEREREIIARDNLENAATESATLLGMGACVLGALVGRSLGYQILSALSETIASSPYARTATTVAGAAVAGLFAYAESKPYLKESFNGTSITFGRRV